MIKRFCLFVFNIISTYCDFYNARVNKKNAVAVHLLEWKGALGKQWVENHPIVDRRLVQNEGTWSRAGI